VVPLQRRVPPVERQVSPVQLRVSPVERRPSAALVKRSRRPAEGAAECFYHEGRPAAGACRSCLKGLCRPCAVDLERGLACRDRCEPAVRSLIATIDQSLRLRAVSGGLLGGAHRLWLGLALVALAVGAFVCAWGLTLPCFREISLLGLPFLAIGAILLRLARAVRFAEAEREPGGAQPA
jgi:hypothetical protein